MELMKVDNEQEQAYAETEDFWEKIHDQRAQSGEIYGWDLWALRPGGENQGYQYMTVTLYSDPASMFKGSNMMAHAKAAYPDMSEEDIMKKLNNSGKTRDLGVRIYMERLTGTTGDFEMKPGIVASFDWMKVDMDGYAAYEKAETEVFMPMHQKQVDAGEKGAWHLGRFMIPVGSDVYASHITVNMFESIDDYFKPSSVDMNLTEDQQKAVQDGLATRDMKSVSLGYLSKMVRKKESQD
jgi:hypothetical protein